MPSINPDSLQNDTNAFEQFMMAFTIGRSLALATSVLLIWDHLTTTDLELRFFWRRRGELISSLKDLSLSRVLFFVNRYVPLAGVILHLISLFAPFDVDLVQCSSISHAQKVTLSVALIISQITLASRTRAIFIQIGRRSVAVLLILCSTFLTCCATIVFIVIIEIQGTDLPPPITNAIHACAFIPPDGTFLIYIPTFVLHTLLYAMTVFHAINRIQTEIPAPIMKVIVRDGTMLYAAVFITCGFSTIGDLYTTFAFTTNTSLIALALFPLITSRLLINLQTHLDHMHNWHATEFEHELSHFGRQISQFRPDELSRLGAYGHNITRYSLGSDQGANARRGSGDAVRAGKGDARAGAGPTIIVEVDVDDMDGTLRGLSNALREEREAIARVEERARAKQGKKAWKEGKDSEERLVRDDVYLYGGGIDLGEGGSGGGGRREEGRGGEPDPQDVEQGGSKQLFHRRSWTRRSHLSDRRKQLLSAMDLDWGDPDPGGSSSPAAGGGDPRAQSPATTTSTGHDWIATREGAAGAGPSTSSAAAQRPGIAS